MVSTGALAVHTFVELARGFCGWCEGESLGVEVERTAASWLARLYGAALELPQVEGDHGADTKLVGPESARAHANLGRYRNYLYRECFDPDPLLDEAPILGDLGDDLQDIYQDLKRGLVLFDGGRTGEAVWQWKFLHRVHWGHHAAGALFALHCLVVSKDDDEDD